MGSYDFLSTLSGFIKRIAAIGFASFQLTRLDWMQGDIR